MSAKKSIDKLENGFEFLVFWSRWIQAPIYGGLIVASFLFAYKFLLETWHLVTHVQGMNEEKIMLSVLTLVDLVMVINVLTMVVIGGYATFVSKLNIGKHEDRPAWLRSMDPGTLKVKLSASLVGVSGIHLLKAFINLGHIHEHVTLEEHGMLTSGIKWQAILHLVFLASAIGLAYSEKLLHQAHAIEHEHEEKNKANAETEIK